ncbi:MAG: carbohydrate binding family 9 domain-containing protein, partial [Calditrichaeota bacterium]|nr:carbohydrate binding family 9 domain-containing protein [Calditrichota bacterium]
MRCLSRLLICYMVFHMMIYSQDEPTLDGDLTDEFWLSASTFSDFLEYSPRIGSQAAEKTIVLLKPGNNFLYIGFKVYSAKPIIANVMERDQPLTDDDFIEIVIDSYNNHTDALSFQTNMLGTRVDYELSENVTVKNKSWNTIWDVETRRTDYGWSAEFRIPFASLRFQSSENVTMGFKFIRQLAADNSFVVYPLTDQNVDNALYNLNFAEPISLGNIDVKQRLLLSPYIVGNLQNRHDLNQPADAYTSST